ncbi:hypothetical protein BKA70DRAFT_772704 [Coprinopsis sp. MPI-PUGE-AT-0042]|nr:hypothetical protein BKA70DRAFT_772704 [Coprinopsis sp. MPI-PUGE-AT-0042]
MPGVPRSFFHLRSFHLSPFSIEDGDSTASSSPTCLPLTTGGPGRRTRIAGRGSTVIALSTLASLIFIFTIAIVLVGRTAESLSYLTSALGDAARFSPGIVLVGDEVNVDIDERSVAIRWSLLACGNSFVLLGSKGMLGAATCGLPASPFDVFADSDMEPSIKYDPKSVPFDDATGRRKRPEAAFQFKTSHLLDTHEARQYPFDTYHLGMELRASNANTSLPISRVFIVDVARNFHVESRDLRSYLDVDGFKFATQHVDVTFKRPASTRLFTLLLFMIGWLLAHINVGQVIMARKSTGTQSLVICLAISGGTIMVVPQLRNSMPGAPGSDNILIDCIGFFPQMAVTGLCLVALLLLLAVREWDYISASQHIEERMSRENKFCFADRPLVTPTPSPRPARPRRPPPLNLSGTTAIWTRQGSERASKSARGEYLFPALSAATPPPLTPASPWKPCHKRNKTPRAMSLMEAGEVSKWSDGED